MTFCNFHTDFRSVWTILGLTLQFLHRFSSIFFCWLCNDITSPKIVFTFYIYILHWLQIFFIVNTGKSERYYIAANHTSKACKRKFFSIYKIEVLGFLPIYLDWLADDANDRREFCNILIFLAKFVFLRNLYTCFLQWKF